MLCISLTYSKSLKRYEFARLPFFVCDVDDINNITPGHSCNSCRYTKDEKTSCVFDNIPQSIPDDAKFSLVYIAGYVVRNRQSTVTDLEDTSLYYIPTIQQLRAFIEALKSYHPYGLMQSANGYFSATQCST